MRYRRIKDLREDADYSQQYVAEKLFCTQATYSRIESGKRGLSIPDLIRLSNLYNVSTDYLLGLSDCPIRIKNKLK
ncbi:TPA: helix-turn-helix transcriptional regulator [Streptococcus suis]|nr:helix-turn-helix transcriptional regulator [Streptococcus suis]HEL2411884.1 helix-turn-helix transcriptional regulator [Streptococcus suis]